jgi:hypothetical protein
MITQPRRLAAHGLSCEVPAGWHVRIEQREQSAVNVPTTALPAGGYVHPILQAATSPLPALRGDYGSGYVETMRGTDVFVCLGEFDHEAGDTAMFDEGLPRSLRSADFHPEAQQRVIAGMCGTQRFFVENGRAFCLYVVLGSWLQRQSLVPVANSLLATVLIDPWNTPPAAVPEAPAPEATAPPATTPSTTVPPTTAPTTTAPQPTVPPTTPTTTAPPTATPPNATPEAPQ